MAPTEDEGRGASFYLGLSLLLIPLDPYGQLY